MPQILTHVREKLQCIEKDNNGLSGTLQSLEGDLAVKRDSLGRAKATRDTLRQKGRKIKESSSYITKPELLDDFEVGRVAHMQPQALAFTAMCAMSRAACVQPAG